MSRREVLDRITVGQPEVGEDELGPQPTDEIGAECERVADRLDDGGAVGLDESSRTADAKSG